MTWLAVPAGGGGVDPSAGQGGPDGLAPPAPGRLGEALPAATLFGYLEALGRWRAQRKADLDRLDQAALASDDPDAYSDDMALAMSLWQATSERYDAIIAVWDSGRADRADRERISQLIAGRLNAGLGSGLAVSFVEACRLSDALTAQLRTRLSLEPAAGDVAARLVFVRAQLARCRELADEPTRARLDRLAARLEALADQAGRGADVGGPLGALENETALLERDLIVAAGRRSTLTRDRERAQVLISALGRREVALRALAARCTDRIAHPPRLAVPDVSALGPVPADRAEVTAYLARLEQVQRALAVAEAAYGDPLAERDELRGRLDGYRAMAARRGRAEDTEVAAAYTRARAVLWSAPCDLAVARSLVADYQALVHRTGENRVGSGPDGGQGTGS